MCNEEHCSLQRGMNFRLGGRTSVILMSVRRGAPYADRVEDNGSTLIYEGHDIPQVRGGPNPKHRDQTVTDNGRTPNQNGKFVEAAQQYKASFDNPELVRVYEKIQTGIWTYAGTFALIDAWQEDSGLRKVWKFKLVVIDTNTLSSQVAEGDLDHNRMIPTAVKLEVWSRDKGKCVRCGRSDNLHFDHLIPFSKGGSSLTAENIQLLCARHNLAKRDRIE